MENEDELIREYMTMYSNIKMEYSHILKVVRYLNREIPLYKLKDDSIRNMDDAYQAILNWNNKISELGGYRASYLPQHVNIPTADGFFIQMKKDEED